MRADQGHTAETVSGVNLPRQEDSRLLGLYPVHSCRAALGLTHCGLQCALDPQVGSVGETPPVQTSAVLCRMVGCWGMKKGEQLAQSTVKSRHECAV